MAITAAITYGLYPPAARAVYAAGGNASFVVLLATLARTFGMWFFCLVTRRPLFISKTDTKAAALGGFLQALCVVGLFAALSYIPGPIVIIVIFTHTLMLLFYMAARREIVLDLPVIVTTLMALVGLSFVVKLWQHQDITNHGVWRSLLA